MTEPKTFSATEMVDALVKVLRGEDPLVENPVPKIEFTCPTLAATTPVPHERFEREYREDNGEDYPLDEEVIAAAFSAGVENGWRLAKRERYAAFLKD